MKFVKNNWTKKLIIVLIVMLLFNAFYPTMTYAVDLGGILLQPLYWLLLGIYIPIDLTIGSVIRLENLTWSDINSKTDDVMTTKARDWESASATIVDGFSKLFIGPDSIFRRRN